MTWRDKIEYWARRSVPVIGIVLVLAMMAAAVLLVPARGAAAVLGIAGGIFLGYSLTSRARHTVQIAVLWAAAAVTADAAYARLNDQAPVTLANALAKIIDAFLKLTEPLIKGLGLSVGDPRTKVGAVAPEFVWALILALVATLAIGFSPFVRKDR
jgi:hypothetical protein